MCVYIYVIYRIFLLMKSCSAVNLSLMSSVPGEGALLFLPAALTTL